MMMLHNKQHYQYKLDLKETAAISAVVEFGTGQEFRDFLYKLNKTLGIKSAYKFRRWTELEPFIMKNPRTAGYYARENLGERWIEAEPYIRTEPQAAFSYSRDVIHGRWLEAEPIIAQDQKLWHYYVRNNTPTSFQKFLNKLNLYEASEIDYNNFACFYLHMINQ